LGTEILRQGLGKTQASVHHFRVYPKPQTLKLEMLKCTALDAGAFSTVVQP
jgi:hypothetical protein